MLHAAAIAALLIALRSTAPRLAPTHLPGTAQGTALLFHYQLQGAPPGAPSAPPREQAKGPALPRPAKSSQQHAQQLAHAATDQAPGDAAEGSEGDGNISIALVKFHPRPQPDLALLPPGSGGDVILDATIDAQGNIKHLSVTHSLGAAVDQQVIATVQTWTFTPATRNGVPIASEQELLFHYQRGTAS